MPLIPLLNDVIIIFGSSLLVIVISHYLRLPAVVGFLLTGMIVGPHGLGLIGDSAHVEMFAELGVVFLLFMIGVELSFDHLKSLRRYLIFGGGLQVSVTIVMVIIIAIAIGKPINQAIYLSFIVAMSSTAIVLTLYSERGELATPFARISMGILLFQDLIVVPMLLIEPILAGTVKDLPVIILLKFIQGLMAVAGVFFVAYFLIPKFLKVIVQTRVRELLVIGALFTCLGAAVVTESLGFSLALGAFLSGILISESVYRYQILAEITSFRDVFNSLFFISIGMLLDLHFVGANLFLILGAALAIILFKFSINLLTISSLKVPFRIAFITSLGLAQIGEFSFILIRIGHHHGLLPAGDYQLAIAVAVSTFLVTPLMIKFAPILVDKFNSPKSADIGKNSGAESGAGNEQLQNHVVIAGYGLNGRHLSRVLKAAHMRYIVVDLNGYEVNQAHLDGESIVFGDVTRREILEKCNIGKATVMVYAISDGGALRRSIQLAREINPHLYIIARTWQLAEINEIRKYGANEVIAQEFETSIELVTLVLTRLHLPGNIIRTQARLLRDDGYQMLRSPAPTLGVSDKILQILAAGTTDTFLLTTEHQAVGKSIAALQLRKKCGASIIAVVRGEKSLTNPAVDFVLEAGDIMVLVGSHQEMESAFSYLEKKQS